MALRSWRTFNKRVRLERPPWFTVGIQDVELPDGEVLRDYNWIAMRSFAIVVPLLEGGRTILARSFKLGVNKVSLSLPAGYLEDGEEPLDGAKRELREETGHEADEWLHLGRSVVYGNYGNYGSGCMHAFLAKGARKECEPDSGDHEEQELLAQIFTEPLPEPEDGVLALPTKPGLGLAVDRQELERFRVT